MHNIHKTIFIHIVPAFLLLLVMHSLIAKPGKPVMAAAPDAGNITIVQKWELPVILTEVSGIDHVGKDLFACVMDEEGIIFMYNTATNTIDKEIRFTGAGDFEGIVVVGKTAWVLRSDGTLFEVQHYLSAKPQVTEYDTRFGKKQNTEGLGYDPMHNRLLISIKRKDPASDQTKGIYGFDLKTKTLATNPAYTVDASMRPSDIAVHPKTGDVYIIDAEDPRLVVLAGNGKSRFALALNPGDFRQPEGITFSNNGTLFICNEGMTQKGNILWLTVDKK